MQLFQYAPLLNDAQAVWNAPAKSLHGQQHAEPDASAKHEREVEHADVKYDRASV